MITARLFDVANGDRFDKSKYPAVTEELEEILRVFDLVPGSHKGEMIVSYLRDHSIKTDYLTADPRVARKILSGSLSTYNIEGLFDSCRTNTTFLQEYEDYIKSIFR